MGVCRICGSKNLVSESIGVCSSCLRKNPEKALEITRSIRSVWRKSVGLPTEPPKDPDGVRCRLCVNECVIGKGSRGFCGVWSFDGKTLTPIGGFGKIVAYIYLDPIPTNCVAAHICPASTGIGYPKYAYKPDVEYGYYNLAVFLAGCPLDCVFCQNWEHKTAISHGRIDFRIVRIYDEEDFIRKAMDPKISCVCYFGGDPTPHSPMLISLSRKIIEKASERKMIKRICWETNGLENPLIMREMARISLVSGGIVKIDWKAYTPSIYEALTGVNGEKAVNRLKENTKIVYEISRERPEIPLLVVSILLVPGYVDVEEVDKITSYIASLDTEIPVVLLAFHPDHLMRDLPPTSIDHAYQALKIAKKNGIKNVYIGNKWLLGPYY
jgi:pyruvate formate lyase activating enzyme